MLFRVPAVSARETEVLRKIEDARSALGTPGPWTGLLRRLTLDAAIQTSGGAGSDDCAFDGALAVEGAIAAAEGDEPVEADSRAFAAASGYRAAVDYVLQLADDPHFTYDEGGLRGLHYLLTGHDRTRNPGRWRPGPICVRRQPSGEIVYDAPGVALVPGLMRELVLWLNAADDTPLIIRAAMAHLNLTLIHPFSDGNGRTASLLQTLVLARGGVREPEFSSIEEYVGAHTADYYAVLATVGGGGWDPGRDAGPWIRFCLTAHLRQAESLVRRTQEYARLWGELDAEIKRRGLPGRVLFALADAAAGLRVRSARYRSAAAVSADVARRDLKLLADEGLVVSLGERQGRSYLASDRLKEIRRRTREAPIEDEDPFAAEAPGTR